MEKSKRSYSGIESLHVGGFRLARTGHSQNFGKRFTFLVEQFWGRAARASNDSKESDARFIFSVISDQEKARPEGFEEHPTPHFWSVVGGYGGGPQFPARFQGKGQSKAPWGPRVVKRTPQIERGELNSNIIFTYADFISTASLIVLRFRNKCLTPESLRFASSNH